MKAGDVILALQEVIGIPAGTRARRIGPLTRRVIEELSAADPEAEWNLRGADTWQPERHISDDGIELVKHFEGCQLKAYQDEVGVWTIGYGHTGLQHKDGTVFKGRTISQTEAERLLRYDMEQFEKRVETFVKVPLTQDQFDALVSFDFNTGGLAKATLLKKLNAGDYNTAANEFLKWDKAGGRVYRGLTRRRKSERNLFLGKRPFIVA